MVAVWCCHVPAATLVACVSLLQKCEYTQRKKEEEMLNVMVYTVVASCHFLTPLCVTSSAFIRTKGA